MLVWDSGRGHFLSVSTGIRDIIFSINCLVSIKLIHADTGICISEWLFFSLIAYGKKIYLIYTLDSSSSTAHYSFPSSLRSLYLSIQNIRGRGVESFFLPSTSLQKRMAISRRKMLINTVNMSNAILGKCCLS